MKVLKATHKFKGWTQMGIIIGIMICQIIHAQDGLGALRQPSSWADYVDTVQAGGTLGEWQTSVFCRSSQRINREDCDS